MQKTITLGKVGTIKYDIQGLERLNAALKQSWVTRVGILGSSEHARKQEKERKVSVTTKAGKHKAGQEASPLTNATIGALHEYGSLSRNIPRRSWLSDPIDEKLSENKVYLEKAYLACLKQVIGGSISGMDVFFKKLGITAEKIIQEAFDTRGFGRWAPLKWRKGSPLIDTGQLRKAVTSGAFKK